MKSIISIIGIAIIVIIFAIIGLLLLFSVPMQNYCTPESRNADACIEIYGPVCGWNNPAQIQCIKYPCAQNYSNSCFACMDSKVLYWTEGTCPE